MNDHAELKIEFSNVAGIDPECLFRTKINIIRNTPASVSFSIICKNPENISFTCNGRQISAASQNTQKTADFMSARISAELKPGSNEIEYSHPLFVQKRTAGSFIFGKSKHIFTAFAELKQIKSVFENRNFSMSIECTASVNSSLFKNLFLSPFIIFFGGKNNGEERGVNYVSKTKSKKGALHSVLNFGIDFPDRLSISVGRKKLFR
ncbi:MAG: hypothetical protein KA015_00245 [Spirochaetes bacterium]|nr:hypothetical protein [Spirochaetota bacterium]